MVKRNTSQYGPQSPYKSGRGYARSGGWPSQVQSGDSDSLEVTPEEASAIRTLRGQRERGWGTYKAPTFEQHAQLMTPNSKLSREFKPMKVARGKAYTYGRKKGEEKAAAQPQEQEPEDVRGRAAGPYRRPPTRGESPYGEIGGPPGRRELGTGRSTLALGPGQPMRAHGAAGPSAPFEAGGEVERRTRYPGAIETTASDEPRPIGRMSGAGGRPGLGNWGRARAAAEMAYPATPGNPTAAARVGERLDNPYRSLFGG